MSFLEPVGTKPPTFSTDARVLGIDRTYGQSFALLCPAQALPAPSFRLVKDQNVMTAQNGFLISFIIP